MFRKNTLSLAVLIALVFTLSGCTPEEMYMYTMKQEQRMASLREKSIRLDYGTISYLENDVISDKTLLLVHGYTSNKDIWNKFVTMLGSRYHIIVPDLAGHGKSVASMQFDYTYNGQVRMLQKFIQAKRLDDFTLIGNSMGGGIGIVYTQKYPEKVDALVLMDTAGFIQTHSAENQEISPENPLYNVCTLSEYDHYTASAMEHPPYIPSSIKNYLMRKKCARHDLEAKIYFEIYHSLELDEIEKEITTPTLIIWGEKDRLLHVDNAQMHHANIANSEVKILHNIGHLPMYEAPFLTSYYVRAFLDKL